jgi:hypothetical protein
VQIAAMPVCPVHHRRDRDFSVLIDLHVLCIFKLLALGPAALEFSPLRRLIAQMRRARNGPHLPVLPSGA